MNEQFQEAPEKRNKWLLPVGIGCIVILCLCGGLVGGFFLVRDTATGYISDLGFEDILPTEMVSIIEETLVPMEATEVPEIAVPTSAGDTENSNGQYQDEFSFMDDFSSNAFDWIEYEDEITVLKLENEAYSFQILEPEYYDWSYIPTSFYPHFLTFDVYGLPGEQDGTFGVMCQYQDEYNYYYVEIDLQTQEYVIAEIYDDEYILLNEPLEEDYDWLTADALNLAPEEPNTITVECSLSAITLIINDEFVNSVVVTDQFSDEGDMAFFVYAYSFVGSEGYKVFFDNVIAQ